MDIVARRGVILGNGDLCRGTVPQIKDPLHDTLAVGGGAHQRCPVIILHRTGKDFRSAGTVAVDQHGHGQGKIVFRIGGCFFPVAVFILRVYQQSLRQDLIQHLDHRVQAAARIIPQVDDQLFHALALQILQRIVELICRHLVEFHHIDIADLVIQHFAVHGRHLDIRPLHGEIQLLPVTVYGDVHRCPGFALDHGHHLGQLHASHVLAIDLCDNISGDDARLLGRTALKGAGDRNDPCLDILGHECADALIFP